MSAPQPFSPYRGLMPYAEEDAPFFFGRDAETEIISANLMASRLTLLYGASGVGKSSVLRAGAVRHLHQVAHQNLIERGTPEFAVVVFAGWRDDPVVGLLNAINDAVAHAWEGKAFQAPPPSLDFQQALANSAHAAGGDLILILDQFEEYFLYHPNDDEPGSFAAQFARAVNRKDLRASFLISMREDALAKLDRFKGRIPNLFDNYLRIEHLDREAARDAIVKPLEQYNRLSETKTRAVSIQPALVDAVLDQVKAGQMVWGEIGQGAPKISASAAPIETPYLQLVMTRLWDEERRAKSNVLRLATLNRLGGAERIVRTHLDEAMNALSSRDQNVASRVFRFLVTPSGTKIAHTAPDLASYAEVPLNQVTPCLDKLSSGNVRILRPVTPPPDQPQVARYEIFHDVLAPSILDWRARYERRMQRQRVTQIISAIGTVALAIICILAAISLNANLSAQQQTQQAVQSAATAVQQATVAQATVQQQATVVTQQDAITQQQATAVVQLQVAVQTLAPDVVATITPIPTATRVGARTPTPDLTATSTAVAQATADARAKATAIAAATNAAQVIQRLVTPQTSSMTVEAFGYDQNQLRSIYSINRAKSNLGSVSPNPRDLSKMVISYSMRQDPPDDYVIAERCFEQAQDWNQATSMEVTIQNDNNAKLLGIQFSEQRRCANDEFKGEVWRAFVQLSPGQTGVVLIPLKAFDLADWSPVQNRKMDLNRIGYLGIIVQHPDAPNGSIEISKIRIVRQTAQ
jgi:hypothetical protein